jgi:hypothetical protein
VSSSYLSGPGPRGLFGDPSMWRGSAAPLCMDRRGTQSGVTLRINGVEFHQYLARRPARLIKPLMTGIAAEEARGDLKAKLTHTA